MQEKMNKHSRHTYPDKILPTVRSDMMAYHRHGYSFDDYCDRNTHGRSYGKELYDIWLETLEEYKEGAENAGVSEDHGVQRPAERKNRRRKQQ